MFSHRNLTGNIFQGRNLAAVPFFVKMDRVVNLWLSSATCSTERQTLILVYQCSEIRTDRKPGANNFRSRNDHPYHLIEDPLLIMLRFPHPPVDRLLIPLWIFRAVPIAVDLPTDCLIFWAPVRVADSVFRIAIRNRFVSGSLQLDGPAIRVVRKDCDGRP